MPRPPDQNPEGNAGGDGNAPAGQQPHEARKDVMKDAIAEEEAVRRAGQPEFGRADEDGRGRREEDRCGMHGRDLPQRDEEDTKGVARGGGTGVRK